MFKVWAKLIKDNTIIADFDIEDPSQSSFSFKRDLAFEKICDAFDLSVPVWLPKHTQNFSQFNRATFFPEDFLDEVDFDRMEFDLIKTDVIK
jgi:hypothetical protein